MRQVDHETVMEELKNRRFKFDNMWVGDYERDQVDNLEDYMEPNASSASVLDWAEIEGQVYDGLFEDPQSEFDFTRFFTVEEGLVARLMYYMISTQGTDYTYENLVDDIEKLSVQWDAPFDRHEALAARP